MPKVICELENASTEINGIKFVPHANGKSLISEGDVGEPHLSIFLSIPGYVAEGDESDDGDTGDKAALPPKEPEPKPETAAQRKARLKSEQEAAEKAAAAQATAEKAAAEKAEAERLAAEAAAETGAKNGEGEPGTEGKEDEVF